jgi:putative PIN family toxin of toxin-antitoxin system
VPRLVADTNTVVSALVSRGTPHRLLATVERDDVFFFASPALIEELADVLPRRKLARYVSATGKSVATLVAEYHGLVQLVQPQRLAERVCRDPDDQAVIECALAARTDLIVSGDRDLLSLASYQGIRIVNAAQALRIVENA